MALLMSDGVTERGTIKEIFCGHRLTTVDSRVELAAPEHRVAVRLHRKITGLELKQ